MVHLKIETIHYEEWGNNLDYIIYYCTAKKQQFKFR